VVVEDKMVMVTEQEEVVELEDIELHFQAEQN
jgi:hypothetical protein